jgi:hypothetical protein
VDYVALSDKLTDTRSRVGNPQGAELIRIARLQLEKVNYQLIGEVCHQIISRDVVTSELMNSSMSDDSQPTALGPSLIGGIKCPDLMRA